MNLYVHIFNHEYISSYHLLVEKESEHGHDI